MNHILIDRRPYFFKYRYAKSRNEWREYERERDAACRVRYGMSLCELEKLEDATPEQQQWLKDYRKYAPLVVSNSPMNLVCKWIEQQDFAIQKRIRHSAFDWRIYWSDVPEVSEEDYAHIVKCYRRFQQDVAGRLSGRADDASVSDSTFYEIDISVLRERLSYICSNPRMVANALLKYLYVDSPTSSKGLLWDVYGRQLVAAAREKNNAAIQVPLPDEQGDICYLGKHYKLTEVDWDE